MKALMYVHYAKQPRLTIGLAMSNTGTESESDVNNSDVPRESMTLPKETRDWLMLMPSLNLSLL